MAAVADIDVDAIVNVNALMSVVNLSKKYVIRSVVSVFWSRKISNQSMPSRKMRAKTSRWRLTLI